MSANILGKEYPIATTTKLDLSYKSFTSLLESILMLSNLKILDLSNNINLLHLPNEISLLKNLILLDCSNNKITKIELTNPKLECLDCSSNELNEFPTIPQSLLYLNLNDNKITKIPYKKIEEQRLISFFYYDNPFFQNLKSDKNLLILESRRQKYIVELFYSDDIPKNHFLEMQKIIEKYEKGEINLSYLKSAEESFYEEYLLNYN